MVDAAVGGKTGINTGAGKNLVGSFHEPAGVLCDLDLLATLPAGGPRRRPRRGREVRLHRRPRDPRPGRGDPAAALDPGSACCELVERAIRVKADVVAGDLRETGGADGHPGREALNYGHTLATRSSGPSGYEVRHGEAVAIGWSTSPSWPAWPAASTTRPPRGTRTVLALGRAADQLRRAPPFDDLHDAMRVDKKARGAKLRFVVLDGLAQPAILAGPAEEQLRAAYAVIGGACR